MNKEKAILHEIYFENILSGNTNLYIHFETENGDNIIIDEENDTHKNWISSIVKEQLDKYEFINANIDCGDNDEDFQIEYKDIHPKDMFNKVAVLSTRVIDYMVDQLETTKKTKISIKNVEKDKFISLYNKLKMFDSLLYKGGFIILSDKELKNVEILTQCDSIEAASHMDYAFYMAEFGSLDVSNVTFDNVRYCMHSFSAALFNSIRISDSDNKMTRRIKHHISRDSQYNYDVMTKDGIITINRGGLKLLDN